MWQYTTMHYVQLLPSPIGDLTVTASLKGVTAILFGNFAITENHNEHTEAMVEWLESYFAQKNPQYMIETDIQSTPFYKAIWQELQRVQCGSTVSYADLAQRVGKPRAVRAVGTAMRRNPLPLYVPCHRVIQSSGGAGNYAGGVVAKKWLLEFEKFV